MSESWQVVSQRQTSTLLNGEFTEAMVVTFRTAAGVVGNVTVPLAQYTAQYVKQLIDARVAEIGSVHSLTSASTPVPSSESG